MRKTQVFTLYLQKGDVHERQEAAASPNAYVEKWANPHLSLT
jgi:hypothetical protein